jgi:hypothetical protein
MGYAGPGHGRTEFRSGRKGGLWCWRGSPGAAHTLAHLGLFLAKPDFRAELGGIVNIKGLIELFREIRDRGKLDAEFIRNYPINGSWLV